MSAIEHKNAGNKAFQEGDYEKAVEEFTKAIELEQNHVFYSNRSGAYAALKKYDLALDDAQKCVSLKPDWAKGYSRLGAAYHGLGNFEEAEKAYKRGLEIEPNNEGLKESLAELQKAQARPRGNPMFSNPAVVAQMMQRLRENPKTREYLNDPLFLQSLNGFMSGQLSPNAFADTRLQTALGVMLGIDGMKEGEDEEEVSPAAAAANEQERQREAALEQMRRERERQLKEEAERQRREEEERRAEEERRRQEEEEADPELARERREREERRKRAEEEKALGNDFYKKKQFDEALQHYNKAFEIDDTNPVYPLNISAVHFEREDYDACIQACELSLKVDSSTRTRLTPEQKSRVYLRLGNAYSKQSKWEKAIEAYKRSILEFNLPQAREQLRKAEQAKRKADEEAYLDPVKSEEAKLAGNEKFQQGQYAEAIAFYNEALKRNPDNYKVYSNRANCFAKLGQWDRALEDCDKCLAKDPAFVKAYIRKGKIQHLLKQYPQALSTFQKGLEYDPNNEELLEGLMKTRQTISELNRSGEVDQERMEASLRDPEVRAIMMDPIIAQVLQDLKENPASAQNALRDPTIVAKLEKLEAAGIVRFG